MAASLDVFVYTMNRGVRSGAWSRYRFPWNCEHFAHLKNFLYIRHGDSVSVVQEGALDDNGVDFDGVIQWPWLDFGLPGVNKSMIGFDIVGLGTSNIEIGYDQTVTGTFTPSYAISPDTLPGQIIPFPIQAPSMSVRLTYDGGQAWQWNALQLYLQDMRPTS